MKIIFSSRAPWIFSAAFSKIKQPQRFYQVRVMKSMHEFLTNRIFQFSRSSITVSSRDNFTVRFERFHRYVAKRYPTTIQSPRSNSLLKPPSHSNILTSSLFPFLFKKYNDYLDILSEILSEASTEENGKQMKTWSGEELEELICGQVILMLTPHSDGF